ncbi:MAG: arabinose ABC transporter substrate-binding protein, partial [Trinickia sp.]
MKRKIFLTLAAAAVTSMVAGVPAAQAADQVKIGFLVKQPEEPWFQDEWKFAEMAAKKDGFTLVKIGATSGEKVMSAID